MAKSSTSESKPAKSSAPKKASGGSVFGRVIGEEELTVFTRQMATLLQSGLPLLRSLEVLIRQERNPKFKGVLNALADNVRTGNNFSDGLAQHPKVFDHLYVSMVKAGEAGGVLETVLDRLATFSEKSLKMKKKVKSAMVYPVIVVLVAVTIVGMLMVFVIPKFQEIFNELLGGASLPWLTQMVINVGNAVKGLANIIPLEGAKGVGVNIAVDILILFLLWTGFKWFVSLPAVSSMIDKVSLMLPQVGTLVSKVSIARFTRTFGTLLSSGVPILQALTITKDVVGNSVVENALATVHDRVRDGETVAAPMSREKVFPSIVTSMVEVGEETGELPAMLNRIADNYDEDVDNAVGSITQIIEPIMIVFLAVVVGIIVIALFLPIVGIIQSLAG